MNHYDSNYAANLDRDDEESDETEKEIHGLRMILVKKSAASARAARIVGPATKRVMELLDAAVMDRDDSLAIRISTAGEAWDMGYITVGEIRAFVAEQKDGL